MIFVLNKLIDAWNAFEFDHAPPPFRSKYDLHFISPSAGAASAALAGVAPAVGWGLGVRVGENASAEINDSYQAIDTDYDCITHINKVRFEHTSVNSQIYFHRLTHRLLGLRRLHSLE